MEADGDLTGRQLQVARSRTGTSPYALYLSSTNTLTSSVAMNATPPTTIATTDITTASLVAALAPVTAAVCHTGPPLRWPTGTPERYGAGNTGYRSAPWQPTSKSPCRICPESAQSSPAPTAASASAWLAGWQRRAPRSSWRSATAPRARRRSPRSARRSRRQANDQKPRPVVAD
ncbi:short chain dehydrogenase domain protein [Mycobacterium xenopi 3993]|nr:short chain dehydrogenase domain protein [Mycobacterium xenopi 3993]